ncbi:MAG: cobalt ECF transporter T component CbiQ [Actinomycetota bacterium]|nr:MAG: cobalt ECF transporter T component CbiQ [Actinomycetota bacterium]
MSGPHAHALYVHGHTPVHRLAPEAKLAAQLVFVIAVVATPREAFWAFGVYAALVLAVVAAARLPVAFVAKRLLFEVPFVLFATTMPFVARGERVDVLGLPLSVEGLWGAWNILAKATIGLAASIVVAATTTMPELLRGFERLRMPRAFTSTLSFMIRYADVVADDLRRMKIARDSRGYDPRWLWQARAIGAAIGALFIRSYERGERVYLAMLSRGYAGSMPRIDETAASAGAWAAALSVPAVAVLVATSAWVVGR